VIAKHFQHHADRVSIGQQSQQLTGEAAMPYSVLDCCEIDKHGSGFLLSRNATLDVSRQ